MANPNNGAGVLQYFYQTHQKLQIRHEDIKKAEIIAANPYSDVYKAILRDNDEECEVVSKELRVFNRVDGDVYKRLARELHIWVSRLLNDDYVLPIYRFAINPVNNHPVLVTKFMKNGNLNEHLERMKDKPIDFMNIIRRIASGLIYLHDNNVTHGDVKCPNILMSSDEPPKPLLVDFGLSHVLNPGTVTIQVATDGETPRGTARYMAKEMLVVGASKEHFYTKQADVWAFGMTIYEIIIGKIPYHETKHDFGVILAINKGKLPVWPDNDDNLHTSLRGRGLVDQLKIVCDHCWMNVDERPDMKGVLALLEGISENVQIQ